MEFLEKLNEDLEFENDLTLESDIFEHEEWNSMATLVLMSFVSNNFGTSLKAEDLKNLSTINSLYEKLNS